MFYLILEFTQVNMKQYISVSREQLNFIHGMKTTTILQYINRQLSTTKLCNQLEVPELC